MSKERRIEKRVFKKQKEKKKLKKIYEQQSDKHPGLVSKTEASDGSVLYKMGKKSKYSRNDKVIERRTDRRTANSKIKKIEMED